MDKRPLLAICVFFIIGIILVASIPKLLNLITAFIITLVFAASTVISFKFLRISKIFLFLSITSLGSLLYLNSNIFPPDHISHFLGKERVKAEIVGTIKGHSAGRPFRASEKT